MFGGAGGCESVVRWSWYERWFGVRPVAYLFLGRLYSTSLVSGFLAASLLESDIMEGY